MTTHTIPAAVWLLLTVGGGGFLITQAVRDSARRHKQEDVEAMLRDTAFAGQRGEFDKAQELGRKATEKYPDFSATWVNLAVAYRAGGKIDEAVAALDRALEVDPEDWGAVAERATLYRIKGDSERAVAELERIPEGRGRVAERLSADPAWRDQDDRIRALRVKHDADLGDTGMRRLREMEERRRDFRRANKLNPDLR